MIEAYELVYRQVTCTRMKSTGCTSSNTCNQACNVLSSAYHLSSVLVVNMIKKVSDFIYFLPFLFSLYDYPEPSRMLYDDPHTTAMTYTPDPSSMT